jgi:hypothetical protein
MTDSRPIDSEQPPRRSQLKALLENWMERAEESVDGGDATQSLVRLAAAFGFLCRTKNSVLRSEEWDVLRQRVEQSAGAQLNDAGRRAQLADELARLGKRLSAELAELDALHAARQRMSTQRGVGETGSTGRRRTRGAEDGERRIAAIQLAERFDQYLLAAAALSAFASRSSVDGNAHAKDAIDLAHASAISGEMFEDIAGWFFAMERSLEPSYIPRIGMWDLPEASPETRVLLASSHWISGTAGRIRYYQRERANAERAEMAAKLALRLEARSQQPNRVAAWRDAGKQFSQLLKYDGKAVFAFAAVAAAASPRLAAASERSRRQQPVTLEWGAPDGARSATCVLDGGRSEADLTVSFFDVSGNLARSLDGEIASWCGASAEIKGGRARFPTASFLERVSPLEFAQRCTALFLGQTPWTANFDDLFKSLRSAADSPAAEAPGDDASTADDDQGDS